MYSDCIWILAYEIALSGRTLCVQESTGWWAPVWSGPEQLDIMAFACRLYVLALNTQPGWV